MTATASVPDETRLEAARIAHALIRFQGAVAHPMHTNLGEPVPGRDYYLFSPSPRRVPAAEVEAFLAALPSPAILSPTLDRGVIVLTLLHELSGDRRRWAEHELTNLTAGFDEMSGQLGLRPGSRLLLEFDQESHLLSHAGVREWTASLVVTVGWCLQPVKDDPRAQAQMCIRRGDGSWSPPLMTPGTRNRVTACDVCDTLAEQRTRFCPRCGADRART